MLSHAIRTHTHTHTHTPNTHTHTHHTHTHTHTHTVSASAMLHTHTHTPMYYTGADSWCGRGDQERHRHCRRQQCFCSLLQCACQPPSNRRCSQSRHRAWLLQ